MISSSPKNDAKGRPYRGGAITLKAPKKLPRILTVAETQAILDACSRLRDRFFFALLHESGCRAGEVLGPIEAPIEALASNASLPPGWKTNTAALRERPRCATTGS